MQVKRPSPPNRRLGVAKCDILLSVILAVFVAGHTARQGVLARRKARQEHEAVEGTARQEREAAEKRREKAVVSGRANWGETTKAFLLINTQARFRLYVETFGTVLSCLRRNDLHLLPTGGTLVGALRHGGMIPWDDDIDVYYFARDAEALLAPDGPVQRCLREDGITCEHYTRRNIRFMKRGEHLISAFPADLNGEYIEMVSEDLEERRSPIPREDVFPLTSAPFHSYQVDLPRNITKFLRACLITIKGEITTSTYSP